MQLSEKHFCQIASSVKADFRTVLRKLMLSMNLLIIIGYSAFPVIKSVEQCLLQSPYRPKCISPFNCRSWKACSPNDRLVLQETAQCQSLDRPTVTLSLIHTIAPYPFQCFILEVVNSTQDFFLKTQRLLGVHPASDREVHSSTLKIYPSSKTYHINANAVCCSINGALVASLA